MPQHNKKLKYKVWCVTEGAYVGKWLREADPVPTTCPNDAGHTITSSLTSITEEVSNKIYENTIDPTVTDDFDSGYLVGDTWVNTITDKEFVCADDTAGAAIWLDTTSGAAGNLDGGKSDSNYGGIDNIDGGGSS